MTIYEAIEKGLEEAIKWVGMTYSALCDWIGISEWAVLFMAIGIILSIIGVKTYKRHR